MGIKSIRTALKVDLEKHASQQPGLHVWTFSFNFHVQANMCRRTDGIQTVSYRQEGRQDHIH